MDHHQPAGGLSKILHDIRHFLPAQSPLKDFVHHNTLHAYQDQPFHEALRKASAIFGFKVYLSIGEFRRLYRQGRITEKILDTTILRKKGPSALAHWKKRLLEHPYETDGIARIGKLRGKWNRQYHIDLDAMVHPLLFRILCSYLDQGISIWKFPGTRKGFLGALRELEQNGFSSFFRTNRVRQMFQDPALRLEDLLRMLVGSDPAQWEHYLFDQQFAHQGWSGMVSVVEGQPETLLDHRQISLHDLVFFECLLEIDALDHQLGSQWRPVTEPGGHLPERLFSPAGVTERDQVLELWQEAFEWSYYDQVLAGIRAEKKLPEDHSRKKFQALFCIDDRECSIRRYIEQEEPECETYGTPGFFNVEFFYQPSQGKFYTRACPGSITPRFLIREKAAGSRHEKEIHLSRHSHNFHSGWLISQTLGFWSAFKLFLQLFRPAMSPLAASSFRHMDQTSELEIEYQPGSSTVNGLQPGFTIPEMADRVEGLLRSIGLVADFAPIIYVIGHGASSANNPHYAAYDCGACSGRAGSVNARVLSQMGNHPAVRKLLAERGILIPGNTLFLGGLHDTTRDEIVFYDEQVLTGELKQVHLRHQEKIQQALTLNARERSRRFESINSEESPEKVHDKIRLRSVSLFEPRPELNHATNALCIIGRRSVSKGLFLDRRSFLNSYDYRLDPDGRYLLQILQAAAPVCGGINLEYYFSRVDSQKLGAGSKLPHNVMGLFGVANGIDGDLRPGLPRQMTEVHDPVRLLMVVEQKPELVLKVLHSSPETGQWFINNWIWLSVIDPETNRLYVLRNGQLEPYEPLQAALPVVSSLEELIISEQENFPVYLIRQD